MPLVIEIIINEQDNATKWNWHNNNTNTNNKDNTTNDLITD